ncbi:MAG TPA: hypothetical protein VM618_07725 [Acidimicrobiia bacterium]|nr:hypothetical protein [Acidimicrobiia bacterium]
MGSRLAAIALALGLLALAAQVGGVTPAISFEASSAAGDVP